MQELYARIMHAGILDHEPFDNEVAMCSLELVPLQDLVV